MKKRSARKGDKSSHRRVGVQALKMKEGKWVRGSVIWGLI